MFEKTRELLSVSTTTDYMKLKPVSLYLESLIHKGDSILDEKISKSGKSIKSCYDYIVAKAQEMANGARSVRIEDNIVYGWARHFYDELGEPEDMPKQYNTLRKTAGADSEKELADFMKKQEEMKKRGQELKRLSDLLISSLKWEKDKKTKKFADAYLKICEKKNMSSNDDKYVSWVTRAVITGDILSGVTEIDCDPNDSDIQDIIESVLGDMHFTKNERKVVLENDMPSLF